MDRLPPPAAHTPPINRGASSKKTLRTTEGGEELHENPVKQKGGNTTHPLSIIVSGM
jgi:hypothetical protein